MEQRSNGIRRLLLLLVCGVFGYVVFYNSMLLDRRGASLPGRQPVPRSNPSDLTGPAAHLILPDPSTPRPPFSEAQRRRLSAIQFRLMGWGSALHGRLLLQQLINSSLPSPSANSAAEPASVVGDPLKTGVPLTSSPSAAAPAAAASSAAAGAATAEQPSSKAGDQKPPTAPTRKSTPATAAVVNSIRSRLDAGFRIANAEQCPAKGRELQLVILITSAPGHERQRKAIRLTWGGAVAQRRDVALVFFLGRTSDTVQRAVDSEQNTFGDIVQGNLVDAYNNLTLKSAVMLEWLDTFCPEARMILKTDDDMFINTDNLLTFVRVHSKDTNTFFGRLARRWKPNRSVKSKYYLSLELFQGKYLPDFVTGPAYVMTGDLVRPLYQATLDAKFLPLEDVLVTGVVGDKLGIKRVHAKEFINDRIKVDTCKFATAISVHMIKFEEQFDIWKRIQDGKTRCPRPYVPTGG